MKIAFDNTYARLPERFHAHVSPTKVREPRLRKLNRALAAELGLDAEQLDSAEGAQVFAGNVVPEGAEPIALAYAGHQFGNFVRQLGDGRAILLGEVVGKDGQRRDIQLKGAGRTPFSRGGDGRAALGPVLREYVVSEAMAALGVPTTRALAAVTTGEAVAREELLPGAVLTRVAASHIRVGTFEFFAARSDREALSILASYALARHYPDAMGSGNDARALLDRVIDAQAKLVARWLGVGFVHGVMNTDNTSISGETIDYGPCAFLDEYDPEKKFSSIDRAGRYAFANQPRLAQWNMARLAEALLPLLADGEEEAVRVATEHVQGFTARFEAAHARVLRAKLGLAREEEGDAALAADLLERLASSSVDYTIFFRGLCAAAADAAGDARVAALFAHPGAFHDWAETWRRRLARESVTPEARASAMRLVNPALIPRNHRIEAMIQAALRSDFEPFETLTRALERPYDDQPELAYLSEPPLVEERVQRTYCGT
jgi:protein adenylyltransferase